LSYENQLENYGFDFSYLRCDVLKQRNKMKSINAQCLELSIVIKKLHDGDAITDEELQVSIETLDPICQFLERLGEKFWFMSHYLWDDLRVMKQFQEARFQRSIKP
jgi:hypothetical protein